VPAAFTARQLGLVPRSKLPRVGHRLVSRRIHDLRVTGCACEALCAQRVPTQGGLPGVANSSNAMLDDWQPIGS